MTATAAPAETTETHEDPATACDHCGLPVPAALVEAEAPHQFCCGGCEVAYALINEAGLEDYYAVRDRAARSKQSARGAGDSYAAYDAEAFLEHHTQVADSGLRTAEFRLAGVHCAACVWLVEKLPRLVPGVAEARLSLGSGRVRLAWDPDQVPLSKVAQKLDRLGYAPQPVRDAADRTGRERQDRGQLIRMAVAGALAGNNMLIAVALYAGVFDGIEPQFARLFRWLSLGIGWLSLVWPGATFFRSAIVALRAGTPNLDQPIALALGVGAVAGAANVLLNRGEVYFDSLSVLVFLLLVGRFLQARQQRWAHEAVGSMLSMTPDSCRVVRGDTIVDEPIEALGAGDTVEVRAGELFPADGVLTRGVSAIDRGLLTGESAPQSIAIGDEVWASAQNVAATVRARVTAVGGDTRVGRLARLVEDGLAAKPAIVRFADRVAGWFILAVIALATTNLALWSATGPVTAAIDSTVALLIVACPCALGLATPLTMAVAIGKGSRRGMLIKSAAALERLARVGRSAEGVLLLDKTGTLTTAELHLESWVGDDEVKPLVAAVERDSNHPVGRALHEALGGSSGEGLENREEHHGRGVTADTPAGQLLVGSPRFAEENGAIIGPRFAEAIRLGRERGLLVVVAAIAGRVRAVAGLSDTLQTEAAEQLARLRDQGWRPAILSGDASRPVRMVAEEVGVAPESAFGELSPEEKLERVREAARDPEPKRPTVVMVGDGVNDAAALAAADVGVAVHGGAEASLAAADVYLSTPGIGKLVELVHLARQTMRVARRNLVISLGYNTLFVSLAMAGWVTPLLAAVLMPISSVTVLASAASFTLSRGDEDR